MTDDDDLPVLTHVLRTGDGIHPHTLLAPLVDGDHGDLHLHPFAERPAARPLVIGNDPHAEPSADDGATAAVEPPSPVEAIVADPRRATDAFTLAQDVDVARGAPVCAIEIPALVESQRASVPETPGHDTTLDFSAPAIAEQVRRAVFDDLSARIDTELDARIAQAMRSEFETAVAQLQERLRASLSEALRDVVARAVDEEIARLNWSVGQGRPH